MYIFSVILGPVLSLQTNETGCSSRNGSRFAIKRKVRDVDIDGLETDWNGSQIRNIDSNSEGANLLLMQSGQEIRPEPEIEISIQETQLGTREVMLHQEVQAVMKVEGVIEYHKD